MKTLKLLIDPISMHKTRLGITPYKHINTGKVKGKGKGRFKKATDCDEKSKKQYREGKVNNRRRRSKPINLVRHGGYELQWEGRGGVLAAEKERGNKTGSRLLHLTWVQSAA